MKVFQGRVITPGEVTAEAVVTTEGFNTLASFQMALQFDDKQVKRDDLARLAEVMQSLGYRYGPVRHAGGVGKAWQKRG